MNKFIIIVGLALAILVAPSFVLARTYNPDNVLSDNEYLNSDSMSADSIQEFLRAKGSQLADITVSAFGEIKRAADVFYDASRYYGVSQKLLLVTAQKEQGAITSNYLSEDQKNKLMGYGVYPGNDYTKYLGIFNQINYAAWQFKDYINNSGHYSFQFGKTTMTSDGYEISPYNSATAGLYNYTPNAGAAPGTDENETGSGGNFLFWKVWNNWFSSVHPDGTLIMEEGQVGVYYLYEGKKRPFWSKDVFEKYQFAMDDVVTVSSNEIYGYGTTTPMKYPNGTLFKDPNTGGIYFVEAGKRRAFMSREVFDQLGYDMESVVEVGQYGMDLYPKGNPINNSTDKHPSGTLIKHPRFGGIYLIDNGKKRPIEYKLIFDNQFNWSDVITIDETELNSYPDGSPVLFKDGTLIRDEVGNIFVIEDQKRRHIKGPSVFRNLGYQGYNVIDVPNNIILLHPGGAELVE